MTETPGRPTEDHCWDNFWAVMAKAAVERHERWSQAATTDDEAPPLQEAA
ncbi:MULTISPECIES: hypothetical protein [Streptomyces]|uniref:Uncharacterized protein n=2 Tax=Streptomyces TaxID=1883 RepID=A0ABV9IXR3_9ACTN